MGLNEEEYRTIFSESEDIKGVIEIGSKGEISKFELVNGSSINSQEIQHFLKCVHKLIKGISSCMKDQAKEVLTISSEIIFLHMPVDDDGSSLILILSKDGNIGLARMITGKILHNFHNYYHE